MKRLNKLALLTIILGLGIKNPVNAQLLKKLEAKAQKAMDKQMAKGQLNASVSQSITAQNWEEKKYTKYKLASGGASYKVGEATLSLEKNSNGEVRAVIVDGTKYERDEEGKSEFVRYYSSTKSSNKLIFLPQKILIFNYRSSRDASAGILGQYFLGKEGNYNDVKKAEKFLSESIKNQQADLKEFADNEKAKKVAALAKRKNLYGLEGKDVQSIKIVDIKANHYGFYRPFSYHIEAKLKNGSTISTKNGGFWEDYIITYPNATIEKVSNKILPKQFIEGDAVKIKVVNKYNKLIVAEASVPMKYDEDLTMNYSATAWGKSAPSFKLEVKQVKHAIDGSDILKIRITDLSGKFGSWIFKMRADQTLNLFLNGQPGNKTNTGPYGSDETGPGQNAGNGGNITVIKDPSVKEFNINYSNNGGIGGAGTFGYNRGRDGRDGSYKVQVKPVKF